ncbi:MAG TPA: hypothetical protein DGH68_04640 [Bacteroidetes bacterium]|nr:hypothetical protein [Bacteroidota bacterium]
MNSPIDHSLLVEELAQYFLTHRYTVHGAKGLNSYPAPPSIPNDGFGDLKPRVPDVVGLDQENKRIVFGIVRETRKDLDTEESLTDYNVFLDHRHAAANQASTLVVLLPPSLLADFTDILTHYIHREYWHRVTTVVSRLMD